MQKRYKFFFNQKSTTITKPIVILIFLFFFYNWFKYGTHGSKKET